MLKSIKTKWFVIVVTFMSLKRMGSNFILMEIHMHIGSFSQKLLVRFYWNFDNISVNVDQNNI